MTQPTERRFVMENRLDAEVEQINDELALKANTADLGEAAYLDQTEFTHIGNLDYAQFDTTYAGGSTVPGQLAWDQANETLQFMLDDHVTLQVGQEHVMRVKNNSGSVAIPERTVVMFAGATGNTIKVSPAVSNGSVNVNYLAGITTEEIPAGGFGFVTQLGFINHVDTNAWPVGTILYVDPATPGGLTATEPDLPSWTMPVAAVTKQNGSAGRMLVRAIPGGSGAGGSSVVISDTVPAGGNKGDLWLDSTDGTLYIYFEDVDGSQWIQVQANSALEGSILSRLGALESQAIAYGRPSYNYIINGAFDIWQRGTSANGDSPKYLADRWHIVRDSNAAGATYSRQSGVDNSIQYCIRAQRDSGSSTTFPIYVRQALETSDSLRMAGKTVTLSFYARKGANYSAASDALSVRLYTGTGIDQSAITMSSWTSVATPINSTATLTSSWARYSFTASISSTATQVGVLFTHNVTGTAGANDYFEITGVQLEEGSVATSFRRNAPNIQAELAACQRYYVRWWADPVTGYGSIGYGMFGSSGAGSLNLTLPVEMRVAPYALDYASPSGIYFSDTNSSPIANATMTIDTAYYKNTKGAPINSASGGTGTAYRPCFMNLVGVGKYFGISAEL